MPDVVAHRISFTRDQLIALWTVNSPSQAVRARVRWLFRHRGCRGGAHVKSRLSRSYQISAVEEGCIPTVTVHGSDVHREPSPTSQHYADARCQRPNLVKLRALRHVAPIAQNLVFGCMNVRSAAGKIDDIVTMKHDRSIDVLCLCETWHDEDSVSIRRLRAECLQVLERARPRSVSELSSLSTNHGAVAIAASRGVRLAAVNTGSRKSSFEHICARVTFRDSSCIVLLIYRPGSRAADASFFTELSDLLDRLTTFVDPIIVVGDLNIRLDRPNDPHSCRLLELLATYDLSCRVSSATHDHGGLLDVVLTRSDAPLTSTVEVIDAGFSDYRLLRWTCSLQRPPPVYASTTYRPWGRLDVDAFRLELQRSALCRGDVLQNDANALTDLYNSELITIVDRLLPLRTTTRRNRPSDPWYDDVCRSAKRRCRLLEQRAQKSTDAHTEWKSELRAYRRLTGCKRAVFWKSLIAEQRSRPRQLWKSINTLLGRGRPHGSDVISAEAFHSFLTRKSPTSMPRLPAPQLQASHPPTRLRRLGLPVSLT